MRGLPPGALHVNKSELTSQINKLFVRFSRLSQTISAYVALNFCWELSCISFMGIKTFGGQSLWSGIFTLDSDGQLRVLRAFRLFRLLGKMGDLKKIVTAVVMSIVPTFQALVRAGPSWFSRLFTLH